MPVITFRLSEFYEHKPIIMIFPFCFLSTPHCLTLICISNFYPDNWSQTSCSGLPYGKEQLNTNQEKSFLFNHILGDIELPSLVEQEGNSFSDMDFRFEFISSLTMMFPYNFCSLVLAHNNMKNGIVRFKSLKQYCFL